jgi:hypothetical protein
MAGILCFRAGYIICGTSINEHAGSLVKNLQFQDGKNREFETKHGPTVLEATLPGLHEPIHKGEANAR